MIALLKDPRIFAFVIMALYMANILRWMYERHWVNALYWLSALMITATVTFGYNHSGK